MKTRKYPLPFLALSALGVSTLSVETSFAQETQSSAAGADSERASAATEESEGSRGADGARPAPTLEQAREAFNRGRSLMSEGKWERAEEKFRFAIRVKDTPGLRYYVGYCQERRGLLVEALQTYRESEALLARQAAPDVEKIIPEALERVLGVTPVLFLHDVPPGATLKVDGKERPTTQQFHVNPGTHQIVVEKRGYSTFSSEFTLAEGEKGRMHVKMQSLRQEEASSGTASVEDEGARPLTQRVVFWSSVGVGVAGLGAGVTGAILHSSTKREMGDLSEAADSISGGSDSACANPDPAMETVCSDLERGGKRKNAMGNLMVGGFVAAGVGAAGAVVTHFFWPNAPVRVQVGAAPRSSWVGVSGKF